MRRGRQKKPDGKTSARPTKSAKGHLRVQQIVAAAKEILISGGHQQLSMRNIANRVNVNLGNLYYYFSTKSQIIQALVDDIGSTYAINYEKMVTRCPDNSLDRFMTVVDFLLDDIHRPETRRLFVSLWALLEQEHGEIGNLLEETYSLEREHLYNLMRPISSTIKPGEQKHRAAILSAVIEGLMLMIDIENPNRGDLRGIRRSVRALALRLALDPNLLKDKTFAASN